MLLLFILAFSVRFLTLTAQKISQMMASLFHGLDLAR